jgi:hypothetical protein
MHTTTTEKAPYYIQTDQRRNLESSTLSLPVGAPIFRMDYKLLGAPGLTTYRETPFWVGFPVDREVDVAAFLLSLNDEDGVKETARPEVAAPTPMTPQSRRVLSECVFEDGRSSPPKYWLSQLSDWAQEVDSVAMRYLPATARDEYWAIVKRIIADAKHSFVEPSRLKNKPVPWVSYIYSDSYTDGSHNSQETVVCMRLFMRIILDEVYRARLHEDVIMCAWMAYANSRRHPNIYWDRINTSVWKVIARDDEKHFFDEDLARHRRQGSPLRIPVRDRTSIKRKALALESSDDDESTRSVPDSQPPPLEPASFDEKSQPACDRKSESPPERGMTLASGAAAAAVSYVPRVAAAAPVAAVIAVAAPVVTAVAASCDSFDAEEQWDRVFSSAVMKPATTSSNKKLKVVDTRPFPTCPPSIIRKSSDETDDDVENYTPESSPDFHTQPAEVQQSIASLFKVANGEPLGADDCIDCGKGTLGQCIC